ncbi:MAG: aminotransferase [Muribaculaceae bacterium]|nr:aminotransferase [Muribaculaceae bacterium]
MSQNTPKDGIVIQARSGSTRMPSKILLPFDGEKRIIDIIIEKIKRDCPDKRIVLATTDNPADNVLEEIAKEHGIDCFRGSEEDVLKRFIGAADKFGIKRIIRVCSDNPFLDTSSFQAMFDRQSESGADYVCFAFPDGRPTIKSHLGLFAELATTEALRRAAALTDEKLYREHVTIFLYTHPDIFTIDRIPLPDFLADRTDLRLTLDTPSDFELLNELFSRFSKETSGSLSELIALVDENPKYGEIMKTNILQNEK